MKISNLRLLAGFLAICNLQFAICNSFAQIKTSPGLSISGTPTSGQVALWSDATTLLGDNLLVADTADGSLTIRKNQNGATRLDILNGTDDTFAEALFSMGGGSTTLTIEALSVLFSDAPGLESPGDCIFIPSADIVFAPGFGRTKFGAGDGAGGTLELSIGLPVGGSVVSGASAALDEINIPARTATVSGTTHVTTAKGFNKVSIYQPTYTDASSVTIDRGATLYIEDAPAAAGSVTLTSGYALWVDNGTARFDGGLTVGGTAAPSSGVINAGTGFTIAGAAASTHYLRGSGTNYVDGTIQAGDVPTLNQNTIGSAATLTTTRALWGQNFNGSAAIGGAIELGTAGTTDTTLDRSSAGVAQVEGVIVPTVSSTNTITNKTLSGSTNTIDDAMTVTHDLTAIPNQSGGWTEYWVTGSDFTTTSTSLTTITGLTSGTLTGGAVYEFQILLRLLNAADANGMKWGVTGGGTGSAATVFCNYQTNSTTVSNAAAAAVNQIDTASGTLLAYSAGEGTVNAQGFFTARTTGTPTMSVQILKITSLTATVRVGSVLRIRKAHT